MITYHQLRTFLVVVRTGSLTKAARELNATQPTVSLQLHAIQKFLGKRVFDRDGAGFRLTPAGEKLRRYAEEVLGGLRVLQQDIAALDGMMAGPLAVGATFIVSRYVLPATIFRFREGFPAVNVRLHVDFPEPLFDALSTNIVDVICYLNVRTPPGLTVETVGVDELVVVVSPAHPLARRRRVSPLDLAEQPFVAAISSPLRELIEAKLREVGVRPKIAAEASHHDAVKQLVERNVGYSALIRSAVADELACGRLVALKLEGPPIFSEVVMAYPSRTGGSALIQEFIRFVRADLTRERTARKPSVIRGTPRR